MSKEYTRRFSSIGNIPSHGPFIFFDDFEDLLKWTKYEGTGDSIFELDPTVAYSKNQSLYMKTRTTGAAVDDIIGAIIETYMLPTLELNASIHFQYPNITKVKRIAFLFTFYDGTRKHIPEIHFFPNTPIWQYKGLDGDMHNIPDSAYSLRHGVFHRIQLLSNLNTDKYIALIIDNHYHNLSAYDIYNSPFAQFIYINLLISVTTFDTSPAELYIDDFLLYEF